MGLAVCLVLTILVIRKLMGKETTPLAETAIKTKKSA